MSLKDRKRRKSRELQTLSDPSEKVRVGEGSEFRVLDKGSEQGSTKGSKTRVKPTLPAPFGHPSVQRTVDRNRARPTFNMKNKKEDSN